LHVVNSMLSGESKITLVCSYWHSVVTCHCIISYFGMHVF